jgi:hypothetical protein
MSSPGRLPCRAASQAKSFGEGRLTSGVQAARECGRTVRIGRGRPSAVERRPCPDVGGYGDGKKPGSINRAPYPTHANSECGASVALPDVVVQRSAWLRLGEATSGSLPPEEPTVWPRIPPACLCARGAARKCCCAAAATVVSATAAAPARAQRAKPRGARPRNATNAAVPGVSCTPHGRGGGACVSVLSPSLTVRRRPTS